MTKSDMTENLEEVKKIPEVNGRGGATEVIEIVDTKITETTKIIEMNVATEMTEARTRVTEIATVTSTEVTVTTKVTVEINAKNQAQKNLIHSEEIRPFVPKMKKGRLFELITNFNLAPRCHEYVYQANVLQPCESPF